MKKTLTIFISSLAALPALAFAQVSTTSIQLPDNFVATIWQQANNTLLGLNSYTTMIVGTILAVIVIGILIETLRKPGGS